jgi:methyl-accepting chemotaxis protein
MEQVVDSIRKVSDIVAEISSASAEQSTGIEQVNQAITDMDASTQHNAALVEESAAAATSLQDQAAKLAQVVSLFKIAGQTATAAAPAAPASRLPAVRPMPARAQGRPAHMQAPARSRVAASADAEWETF